VSVDQFIPAVGSVGMRAFIRSTYKLQSYDGGRRIVRFVRLAAESCYARWRGLCRLSPAMPWYFTQLVYNLMIHVSSFWLHMWFFHHCLLYDTAVQLRVEITIKLSIRLGS
jgi:hypothetical protein